MLILGENKPRAAKVVLFMGDQSYDISAMTALLFAKNYKVLYCDISEAGDYCNLFLGGFDGEYVIKHDICYSKGKNYLEKHSAEYDLILLCARTKDDMKAIQIKVTRAYLIFGVLPGSINALKNIVEYEKEGKMPYTLVLRASKEQIIKIKRYRELDIINAIFAPSKTYYVPLSEKDINSALYLEYGILETSKLSIHMQRVLYDIREILS